MEKNDDLYLFFCFFSESYRYFPVWMLIHRLRSSVHTLYVTNNIQFYVCPQCPTVKLKWNLNVSHTVTIIIRDIRAVEDKKQMNERHCCEITRWPHCVEHYRIKIIVNLDRLRAAATRRSMYTKSKPGNYLVRYTRCIILLCEKKYYVMT